jgi:fission process protein 1
MRYAAYSSDVGEAARPVVPKWVVNASYLTVGLYVSGDIGYECYTLMKKHDLEMTSWPVMRTAAHAATFQGIASLGIPFLIIHTVVGQSSKAFTRYLPAGAKWGPSILGLACIPLMPYVDEPVEHFIDDMFDKYVEPTGLEAHVRKSDNPERVRFGGFGGRSEI